MAQSRTDCRIRGHSTSSFVHVSQSLESAIGFVRRAAATGLVRAARTGARGITGGSPWLSGEQTSGHKNLTNEPIISNICR